MTIARKSCRSCISLDALDHRGHTIGALWSEMFLEAEFFKLAKSIMRYDLCRAEGGKHHEDDGDQTFDDEGITVALQMQLLAFGALKHG